MREFENLSEREKAFLTSYIEELLEEHGYFPDAPDVPITDVYVQLREREVRSKPREVPIDALSQQQIDVESGYGRTVELQEAVEKPKFILIGEPGGGKTTTLRYIAINFAVRLARELGLEIDWNGEKLKIFRDFNPTLSLDSGYLPVFVPLGGINEELDVERLVFDAVRELVKNAHEDVKALFDDRNFVRGLLRDWPLMLLFDALDEAGQPVRQGLLNGFGDFAKDHPHIRMIVSMRVANFRELNVPEELRSTYELMPLTESEDRRTFVELWLNRLKTDHPDIQPPEPQAILDIIEHKHGALKNSLENPLMLKMAIEMAFFGGLDALKNAGSRSNFYEFHVKRLFFRALERLGVFKIKGVRWTGERFEFVYLPSDSQLKGYVTDNKRTKGPVSDDKQRKEEDENLFSAVTDALRALSVEMFQHGGRIARDEADKLSAVDKLNKSLSDFQKDLGNRLKVNPHAGIEFLRKDMGVVGEVGGDLYFMHRTFLEYTFSQWLLERWRENKRVAWRYLRECLHSPDMREPILLLAGSLKGKELEDFIKKVMHAGSEYESLFHRDLLMAGLIAGETGYRGRFRNKIISKMPGWRWAREGISEWHPWGELWRDAVIAMGYPRSVLSDLVEALEDEDSRVREAAVWVLSELGIRDKDVVMKIVEKLEHKDSDVRYAAVRALGSLGIEDREVAMKIIERLEDENWRVRWAAMWALGELGVKDKDVVMEIVEKLEDEDKRVRWAAVWAFGELGIKDRDVAIKLVEKLEDEDPNVRYAAVYALDELGIKDRDVAMKIVEKLEHEDSDVRAAAVYALGKLGSKDRDVVEKIVERLGDEESWVREAAVRALGELGIKDRDVGMKILERLEDEDSHVRKASVYALGKLGIRDREMVMKLVDKLEDWDSDVQSAAVRALVSLGIRDRDVVMKIVEKLQDEDWHVREAAVRALVSLGIRDRDVVMKIVEKLGHKYWWVRREAVEALGKLGIKDRDVAMKILERLEDEDSRVRYAAVEALGSLGIRDRDVAMKILERLEDEDSDVRYAAVEALGLLGIRNEEAVIKILKRLEDEHPWVRGAAVAALGLLGIRDRDVVMKFLEKLEHENPEVRGAAVRALGELGINDKEIVMKIVDRLEDENPEVRGAAVWVLSELGIRDREVVMKIAEKLEHKDWKVRREAVWMFGKLGIKDRDVAMKIVERLEDEHSDVRAAAEKALVKLSDEPEVIEKAIKKYAGPGWKQKLDYKLPHSKLGKLIRNTLKIKQIRKLKPLYAFLQKLAVLRCQESVEAFIGWWKESLPVKKCFKETFPNIKREIKEWLREFMVALIAGGATTFLKFGPFKGLSPTERGILAGLIVIITMLIINTIEFIVCLIGKKQNKK